MLKHLLLSILLGATILTADTIRLPEPNRKDGMSLMEAIANRASSRDFSQEGILSKQEISDLLWCANGFNRKGLRTAPSALNAQAIDIYLFNAEGIWLYLPQTNELELIKSGDFRAITGKQDFVAKAAINLVYVYNTEKWPMKDKVQNFLAAADAAFQAENVYLYCAANNIKVVVRGSFQEEELKKELSLPQNKIIVLAQSIGR